MDMNWLSQAVCLNDKVYFSHRMLLLQNRGRLYIYTPASDSWDSIDTPVYNFALTTYRSQLVLVGGINCDDDSHSAKLWTLSEDGQWQETLPPMETACTNASAVSCGDHLLVIDGDCKKVEVYYGHNWAKAQSLPEQVYGVMCTVYHDNLYVMVWSGKVYSASLHSLIASCQPSETSQPSSVWKKLPNVPDSYCYPTVFGKRLTVIGMSGICAYSPSTQSWISVGDNPYGSSLLYGCCAISLPFNVLMVVHNGRVSKATIKSKCSEVEK